MAAHAQFTFPVYPITDEYESHLYPPQSCDLVTAHHIMTGILRGLPVLEGLQSVTYDTFHITGYHAIGNGGSVSGYYVDVWHPRLSRRSARQEAHKFIQTTKVACRAHSCYRTITLLLNGEIVSTVCLTLQKDHIEILYDVITQRPPLVTYPREYQKQILTAILNNAPLVDLPVVDVIRFETPSISAIVTDGEYPDPTEDEISEAVEAIYQSHITTFHLVRMGVTLVTVTVYCENDDLKFRFY